MERVSRLLNNEKFKEIKNLVVLYSFIFFCCLYLFGEASIAYTSNVVSLLLKISRYAVYAVMVLNCILNFIVYKYKPTIISCVFILIAFCVFILSKDKSILILAIFLFGLSNFKFDTLLKKVFLPLLCTFLLIWFLSEVHAIPNWEYPRNETSMRYSMGFYYPTIASTIFMFIILIRSYVKKLKISYLELLLYTGISVVIFLNTDSRAGFILTLLILLSCLIYRLFFIRFNLDKKQFHISLKVILISLPVIFVAGYLFLVLGYHLNWGIAIKLDSILSGRLALTVNAFKEFKLSAFGYGLVMNGWGGYGYLFPVVDNYHYNYIDNVFMYIFFCSGIVTFFAVILMYMLFMYKATKERNISIIFAFIMILMNGFVEPNLITFPLNIFLLYFCTFMAKAPKTQESQEMEELEQKKLKSKISIIVPVWNGEKYIRDCLNCIMANNVNKEIIVVNDCSTDGSMQILNEFKDDIKIVDLKENKGLCNARNVGMKEASGEFIAFVDIDDKVEPNMYAEMLNKLEETDADVCICNYVEEFKDRKVLSKHALDFESLNGDEIIKSYLDDKFSPYAWDKVYRKSVIENIKFDVRIHAVEDAFFNLNVCFEAKKLVCVNKYFYHYNKNNSQSLTSILCEKFDFFKNMLSYLDKDKLTKIQTEFPELYEYYRLQMIMRGINAISNSTNIKNIKKAKKYLESYCDKEELRKIYKSNKFPKFVRIECKLILMFGYGFHLLMMPFYKILRNSMRGENNG